MYGIIYTVKKTRPHKKREVIKMTQFEKDIKHFTDELDMGIISYFTVKETDDILIIETDEEIFYYSKETKKEI